MIFSVGKRIFQQGTKNREHSIYVKYIETNSLQGTGMFFFFTIILCKSLIENRLHSSWKIISQTPI